MLVYLGIDCRGTENAIGTMEIEADYVIQDFISIGDLSNWGDGVECEVQVFNKAN